MVVSEGTYRQMSLLTKMLTLAPALDQYRFDDMCSTNMRAKNSGDKLALQDVPPHR